jgi:hypothetical protein
MGMKLAVHFRHKMPQKITPANVAITQYTSQDNATYKIGLNPHIGELTLVKIIVAFSALADCFTYKPRCL